MRFLVWACALMLFAAPVAAQVPAANPSALREAARARADAPPQPGPPEEPETPQTPSAADYTRIAPGIARNRLCDVVAWERSQRALSQTTFPCFDWRAEVSWIRADGEREPYARWPQTRRDRLDQLFMALLTQEPDLGVACPSGPVTHAFGLSERLAEDIYLVHVAHALMLERERLVPARLHRLPQAERAVILAPEFYVNRVLTDSGAFSSYALAPMDMSALAFDCDPRVGFRFMQGLMPGQPQNLIGATDLETLRNLTTWFRTEVGHGGYSEPQHYDHAHLADRLMRYRSYTEDLTAYWAVMGCHDAAPLFADLARSVNIPLLRADMHEPAGGTGSHAGLVYAWTRAEVRVVPHVDALYAEDTVLFPIDAAGAPLTQQAREQAFFDTHWVTPGALAAYGFDYTLRPLTRADLGPYAMRLEHYGWLIGTWRAGSVRPVDNELAFILHKALASGGLNLVSARCGGAGETFPPQLWDAFLQSTNGSVRPLTRADVADRMDQIARAYGGCEAIRSEIARAAAYKLRPL